MRISEPKQYRGNLLSFSCHEVVVTLSDFIDGDAEGVLFWFTLSFWVSGLIEPLGLRKVYSDGGLWD